MAIRERIKAYIENYKSLNPCISCGETDIRLLQFDHRDSSEKVGPVNKLANSSSLAAVIEEINKCDVRCANCHQLRHYMERN